MIVLGGCHVTGFKVGQEESFTNTLKQYYGLPIKHYEGLVSFKKLDKILEEQVNTHHPSIIILQVGNFEFNASFRDFWRKCITRKKVKKTVSANNAQSDAGARIVYDTSSVAGTAPRLIFLLQLLTIFLYFTMCFLCPKRMHLQWLKTIRNVPENIRFVVIAPLPTRRRADNLMRKLGGYFLRWKLRNIKSILYVDCYDELNDPAYFIDDAHLNVTGHAVLAQSVYKHMVMNAGSQRSSKSLIKNLFPLELVAVTSLGVCTECLFAISITIADLGQCATTGLGLAT